MVTVGQLGLLLLTAASWFAAAVSLWAWLSCQRSPTTDPEPASGRHHLAWPALLVAAAGGWLATAVVAFAFASSDWRFAYVTDHARPDVAWPLRVAGLWAGPEGSLLLWSTMAATVAVVAARLDRRIGNLPASVVAAGHGAITLTLANPFQLLPAPPAGGTGLQPVLEHPAMVWHPPVLYAGLLGLLVPAGLMLSSAVSGRSVSGQEGGGQHVGGQHVGLAARRSMLAALGLLTVGLATGANWAYVELGWGGYWAWDPIENAGLIAWLLGASVVHRLEPDRQPGRAVTVAAVLPAVAALWATTITRTGVLNSVHSFADQPGLRTALLLMAAVTTVGLLAMAAISGPVDSNPVVVDQPRLTGTAPSLIGSVVILVAAALVTVGTYQPAFAALLGGDRSMTGAGFYATVLWPVVVLGAITRVGAAATGGSRMVMAAAVAGALAAMVLAGPEAGVLGLAISAAGGAVVGAVAAGRLQRRSTAGSAADDTAQSRAAGSLAHVGIGLLLAGVGGAMASTTDTVQATVGVTTPVEPGGGAPPFDVRYEGVELTEGDGLRRAIAAVVVDGRPLEPSLTAYVRTGATSVETATRRSWLADTQVSLVDADSGRAIMRVSRHPGMSLVWLGAAVTAAGFLAGTFTVGGRRRRPTLVQQPGQQ